MSSYLERAKNWIQNGEDIDIENIESTIVRFEMEKKNLTPREGLTKLDDLAATIDYLKEQLCIYTGLPVNDDVAEKHIKKYDSLTSKDKDSTALDLTPLIDYDNSEKIKLSETEKEEVLSRLKNLDGVWLDKTSIK